MARRFQFITVPDPTGQISPRSRKAAHSHVLRQRHARERHSRTEAYQRVRAQTSPELAIGQLEDQFQSRMLGHCKDPFLALSRTLTPQEYFLLDYYVHVIVPYTAAHCPFISTLGVHQEQFLSDWVGLAITDPNLLDTAILLSSCQHILRANPENPTLEHMALEYKHKGLQALRRAVASLGQVVTPVILAQSLALAFDEQWVGHMGIAKTHLEGTFAMVQSSGGPQHLGMTGLLETMCTTFIGVRGLEDKELESYCWK